MKIFTLFFLARKWKQLHHRRRRPLRLLVTQQKIVIFITKVIGFTLRHFSLARLVVSSSFISVIHREEQLLMTLKPAKLECVFVIFIFLIAVEQTTHDGAHLFHFFTS
jgi:hypothetical protein